MANNRIFSLIIRIIASKGEEEEEEMVSAGEEIFLTRQ